MNLEQYKEKHIKTLTDIIAIRNRYVSDFEYNYYRHLTTDKYEEDEPNRAWIKKLTTNWRRNKRSKAKLFKKINYLFSDVQNQEKLSPSDMIKATTEFKEMTYATYFTTNINNLNYKEAIAAYSMRLIIHSLSIKVDYEKFTWWSKFVETHQDIILG